MCVKSWPLIANKMAELEMLFRYHFVLFMYSVLFMYLVAVDSEENGGVGDVSVRRESAAQASYLCTILCYLWSIPCYL